MKRIGVASSGIFHPPLAGRWFLRSFLNGMPDYQFSYFGGLEELANGRENYDALVVYFHRERIGAQTILWLAEYLQKGGGLLALHSASASCKQSDLYWSLLGGRFTRHGPITKWLIRQSASSRGNFREVGDFFIRDELYFHDFQDGNNFQFYADSSDGPVPVVWTRESGAGRVCYSMFGHCSGVFLNVNIQSILADGLRWVCEGGMGE